MDTPSEDTISKFTDGNHSAFIVGYTGETGKQLARDILERKIFSKLVLIGRRKVTHDDPLFNKAEQRVVNFDDLNAQADSFKDFTAGFCCLGTTKGKAGKEGFYKVDHDYVVNVANLCKAGGCQDFHLVSSKGANRHSCLLYARTKGEVEAELAEMGFRRLNIYRPAMLMVDREESRPVERCMRACMRPLLCCCPTLMTTPVTTLARAMANASTVPITNTSSCFLHDNTTIFRLAG